MTASSVTGTAAGDGAAGEVAAGPFAAADADDAVRGGRRERRSGRRHRRGQGGPVGACMRVGLPVE